MKKKFLHACSIGGSIYGKIGTPKRATFQHNNKVEKKDVVEVYNKFYKNQVSALYKAIHRGRTAS
ncbi:MAG TPA: hypothetical protein PKY78_05735 [Candidatus Omnitrophota bacterium]|nr:hypothetical protein [Candidatus Omnitrophota bacterium]HPS20469.1 hypothetical protein [Candidatus Omnitrophota bacterium]